MFKAIWRGCHVAARFASTFHDAHDFAATTLCGMPLTGMREVQNYGRMEECPACAREAAK